MVRLLLKISQSDFSWVLLRQSRQAPAAARRAAPERVLPHPGVRIWAGAKSPQAGGYGPSLERARTMRLLCGGETIKVLSGEKFQTLGKPKRNLRTSDYAGGPVFGVMAKR